MLQMKNEVNLFDKVLSCLERDDWYSDDLVKMAKKHLFLIRHSISNEFCPTSFYFYFSQSQMKVTPLDVLEDSAFKTSIRLKGTKLERLLDNNDDKQFLDILRKRMRKTVLNKERDLNNLLLSKPVDVSTLINKYEREIVFLDFTDVYHIFAALYNKEYDACRFYCEYARRNKIIKYHKNVLNKIFDSGMHWHYSYYVCEYLDLLIEQLGVDIVIPEIIEAIKRNHSLSKTDYPAFVVNWIYWLNHILNSFPETKRYVDNIALTFAKRYVQSFCFTKPDKFFEYFECTDNNLKELIAYYILQFRVDVYSIPRNANLNMK